MITILAEKPDVANKIAAALDVITLDDGTKVTFSTLKAKEKAVKKQQTKDGYLKIKYNGQECYVTWAYGHLCKLKQAKDYNSLYARWTQIPLPFIPMKYEIQLHQGEDSKWNDRIKKQFNTVKRLFNSADYIINATDFDREGEVIFSYIYQLAGCKKPFKRACFSSQTQSGIVDGFTKDLKEAKDVALIEQAGRMRSIADWVVGINLTVATTLKNPNQGIFSVGRVQTPTLAMFVERELAIRKFKSEPYWAIEAEFTTKTGETFKAKHSKEKIFDEKAANSLCESFLGELGVVTQITKKTSKKPVPLLYSLSALQMEANSKFGFTLAKTLEVAQKLYDNGYTTYPRTNSQYLTEDMVSTIDKTLDKISAIGDYKKLIDGRAKVYDKSRFFDDSKVESHFAIIPTGNIPTSLSEDEKKIYDLICKSIIRMLYNEATVDSTKVTIEVKGEKFSASGSMITDMGWMVAGDVLDTDVLPVIEEKDELFGVYKKCDKKTQPPKRYTDKTILAAMLSAGKDLDDAELKKIMADPKTGGIGTEATRASIVQTLISRGFVERDKKALIATDKAINLIEKLPLKQIKSAELTAQWEQRLNDIARGKENADVFRSDIEKATKQWVKEIDDKVEKTVYSARVADSIGVCPKCGKPIIEFSWGFGCTGYKEGCKFSVGTLCKKKITKKQVKDLLSEGSTSLIKGFTSKTGKKFNAKLVLVDGDIKFKF